MKKVSNLIKEGERRQATILFGDISGFTSMAEKMDPEEVTLIVNDCLRIMGSIIEKNEGTIDKYMGDCIMASFGIPTAIEEAPHKALNAAIEIRNIIEQINQSKNLQNPLGVHIGINTGIVVTGFVGSDNKQEYTVMGDTVNVASRLKDVSKAGQIYVGSSTYRHTKRYYEYKELDPIFLKGKEEPVTVYELLPGAEKIYRANLESDRMIYSEMVGRGLEFDKLTFHLKKVINGKGSILSISGEAGIGKSRLVSELRRRDEIKKVTYIEGRALSYGKNLSYHPIIDILKQWVGIKETDTEEISYQKLQRAIRTINPTELTDIFPFVATLLGLKLTGIYADRIKGIEGEALEKLIIKTFRDLIEKAALFRPVVFVLDDLHWADLTSIEFLKSLCRLAEKNPILFILVYRPDFKDTSGQLVETIKERYSDIYEEIYLESLGIDQSEALIANLIKIKGIPGDIIALITKRSGGNPFFIEEIVRSFIDDGVIEIKGDKFIVTERINSVEIPETINEVLMARIDKLDVQTRSLLKVASVIGRNFFYKILAEVAKTTQEIDDRLEYLEGIQLIRKRKRMFELEYLFKHALAQEATYESILIKKRKELHLKTANAIERVFSQRLHEFYGMLALHYSKGEDLDKSEMYLIKAGEEALKVSASSEALHFYQDALTIYMKKYGKAADPEKINMLEKNIAFAFHNKGQLSEALKYIDKVLLFYGVKSPQYILSIVLTVLAGFAHLLTSLYLPFLKWKKNPTKNNIDAIKLSFIKLNCIGVMAPKRLVPEAFNFYQTLTDFNLTRIEMGSGMFSGASVLFSFGGVSFTLSKRVLEVIKDKVDNSDFKSVVYYEFAEIIHHFLAGSWSESKTYDRDLVDSALKIGEVLYTTYYVDVHTLLNIELGNYNMACELVEKLEEIGDKYEHNYAQGLRYFDYTKLLMKYGKFEESLKELERGIEFLHGINDKVQLFKSYSLRAHIQLKMGDIVGAEESLAIAGKTKLGNPIPLFKIDFFQSQFIFDVYKLEKEIRNGNLSKASKYSKKAFQSGKNAIKVAKKVARNQAVIYKYLGTYYWLINKQRKALIWWNKSIQVGERLGAKLSLSRVYMEIGKRLLEGQSRFSEYNGISASQYLDKANSLFKAMDLKWDMEELEKIKQPGK